MKDLQLSGRKPLLVERPFRLTGSIRWRDIRDLFDAFANAVIDKLFRTDKQVEASLHDAIRRSFTVADEEGKFTCESLPQLADHLGQRSIRQFEVKLEARFTRQTLTVRSDPSGNVVVRAASMTRDAAIGLIEATVTALRLRSPGGEAALEADLRRIRRSFPTWRGGVPRVKFDAFISHASEDRVSVAGPLRVGLERHGYRVWLDKVRLKVGDSLQASIDDGLRQSLHGIVVLSPNFFKKRKVWPKRELAGLFSREQVQKRRTILPVLHGLRPNELARYSPMLADRVSVSTRDGIDAVVRELAASMGIPLRHRRR